MFHFYNWSGKPRTFTAIDDIIEIYVHTSDDRGRTNYFVADYKEPLENFIDCDTTHTNEYQTFTNLKQKLKI